MSIREQAARQCLRAARVAAQFNETEQSGMRYMILIYTDEKADAEVSESELGQVLAEYKKFSEAMAAANVLREGAQLRPTSAATTVRVRNSERLVTDGPYAEVREQLGGYYVIECDDIDAALNWAAQCPAAQHGSVELRPMVG